MANENGYYHPGEDGRRQQTPPPVPDDGIYRSYERRSYEKPPQQPPYDGPAAHYGGMNGNARPQQNNPMGVAGFVLAVISVFCGWIPFFGWIVWLLAVIFSAIGLTNKPRGLAVAGIIICILPLLLIVLVLVGVFSSGIIDSLGVQPSVIDYL